ncbi:MAG: exonuclease domain-containing protein [Acidobacteria bacterium]|nr:exonuclease domain-containing protein [Acidobacteriota bacterium]
MGNVAVIDVETTGFNANRSDRIVEIAIVLLDEASRIAGEFSSLLNPERDVGPTRIHGITPTMVRNAPRFAEIAGQILDALGNVVAIAGHNVKFDIGFLKAEFERTGYQLPELPALCTMRLAGGGTLESVCFDYDVARPVVAHSAASDALATANVLQCMLANDPDLQDFVDSLTPPCWPKSYDSQQCPPLRREDSGVPPFERGGYLQKLARRIHGVDAEVPTYDPSPRMAYAALLAQAMQDRIIDDKESAALISLAEHWNLTATEIATIHQQYLLQLQIAALADGVVSETERADLRKAASLLGISSAEAERELDAALEKLSAPSPCGLQRLKRFPLQPTPIFARRPFALQANPCADCEANISPDRWPWNLLHNMELSSPTH